jgi:hypothetical protein
MLHKEIRRRNIQKMLIGAQLKIIFPSFFFFQNIYITKILPGNVQFRILHNMDLLGLYSSHTVIAIR